MVGLLGVFERWRWRERKREGGKSARGEIEGTEGLCWPTEGKAGGRHCTQAGKQSLAVKLAAVSNDSEMRRETHQGRWPNDPREWKYD